MKEKSCRHPEFVIYMRFISLFNQIFPSYTIIIIDHLSKRCYISQIYSNVNKAIGNCEVGGGGSVKVYIYWVSNPFLPSFLPSRQKMQTCVFLSKIKKLEVSQKKKRIQKTPKKRLFYWKKWSCKCKPHKKIWIKKRKERKKEKKSVV